MFWWKRKQRLKLYIMFARLLHWNNKTTALCLLLLLSLQSVSCAVFCFEPFPFCTVWGPVVLAQRPCTEFDTTLSFSCYGLFKVFVQIFNVKIIFRMLWLFFWVTLFWAKKNAPVFDWRAHQQLETLQKKMLYTARNTVFTQKIKPKTKKDYFCMASCSFKQF